MTPNGAKLPKLLCSGKHFHHSLRMRNTITFAFIIETQAPYFQGSFGIYTSFAYPWGDLRYRGLLLAVGIAGLLSPFFRVQGLGKDKRRETMFTYG
ncbi:hypothetical protein I7I53_06498 [Histoplasma capsulatum var. duboisii H88]|uniref:Uncharacterized protein n=1 Tax=Ajellomyces capsulatus (strain H88) TaxID=544711 RepID=A0A8A1LGX4_AJEC8|nr:hypothetical protein I7I53_06498 [Histoplasma capsulatum var. duboisii H88]